MTLADLSLLVLRLAIGLVFTAHGAQKAFGWWNGPGFANWQKAMASMRFQPAPLWAFISVAAELGGGVLLVAGFLTPLVAAVLLAQSAVIILKVHLPNGFWNGQKGYEFPLALTAGVVAILGVGPGALSVDAAVGFSLAEPVLWLLLAAGILAGLASYGLTQVMQPTQPATQQR
jgi:putative oxidoreductase